MRVPASVAVVVAALAGAGSGASGCATLPPAATAEGCARARLARQWQGARPETFIGCYVDEAGAFSGTLILSHLEDEAAYDDEPRRFRLTIREAMLASDVDDDGARWELLQDDLVRLSFPAPRTARPGTRAFEAVEACVQRGPEAPAERLTGEVAAVIVRAPFLGPPSPVRLRRVPCVR